MATTIFSQLHDAHVRRRITKMRRSASMKEWHAGQATEEGRASRKRAYAKDYHKRRVRPAGSRRNEYENVRRRRALAVEFVHSLKDGPCCDCGGRFPPCAMDFDHVRGEKSFVIAANMAANRKRLLLEIEKCDLVCANCHRIRTQRRIEARRVVDF